MTSSVLVNRFVRKRGRKNRPEPELLKCRCGFSPILASSFDVASRVKLFWFECPNDECLSLNRLPRVSVKQAAEDWNAALEPRRKENEPTAMPAV
jgi:hypothetical protein